jgi:hypothetical protein
MENLLYFFHLISNSNIQDLTLLPQSFEALAQGIHPSVALAQEGGVVLQSLGPEDRALHSFSVGGEKYIFSRIPVRMEG